MGRCIGCRKQTQIFCYVHQEFVGLECLVGSLGHARCYVGSYRGWVQDSSYPWPPKCVVCSKELMSDDGVTRLTCLAIVEDSCLMNRAPGDGKCPHCETSLVPPRTDGGAIAQDLRIKLKDVPLVNRLSPNIEILTPEQGDPFSARGGDVAIEIGAGANTKISSTGVQKYVDSESVHQSGIVPELDEDDKQLKAQKERGRRTFMSALRFFRTHRRGMFFIFVVLVCVAISVGVIRAAISQGTANVERRRDAARAFQETTRNPRNFGNFDSERRM
ncbi:hypothetical protein NDN08_004541 [Rhodosorus marinus]|uniref:ZFPL1-like B-box zinc-binding domain-containing protein n=1 Tax=Rhodosorus marinus TaxID=101924 RepID=A0AAV8UPB1_9RHOD|nr:hypothetical protein NDN08_004541 [Rhodosorus marinus]